MSPIPVENKTEMPMYVGSTMILPGETRHFEEHQVPAHLRPAATTAAPEVPAEDPADVAVRELLEHTVAEVAVLIQERKGDGQPTLSDDDLARLKAAEEAGKARKSLLAAIAEEELRRADERQDLGDPEMDAYVSSLKEMGDAELNAQIELVQDNPSAAAAVQNEIDARKAKQEGGNAGNTAG